MDFPERSHVKAPRGFRFSLWALYCFPGVIVANCIPQLEFYNGGLMIGLISKSRVVGVIVAFVTISFCFNVWAAEKRKLNDRFESPECCNHFLRGEWQRNGAGCGE